MSSPPSGHFRKPRCWAGRAARRHADDRGALRHDAPPTFESTTVIRGLAAVVAAILIAFAVAASPAGAANGPPAPIETVGPAGVLG